LKISWPAKWYWPQLGRSSRPRILSRVLLPEPEAPREAAAVTTGDEQADIIGKGQVLPGQLIAFADALQGDQAWVRGSICHEYAFSLDAVVIVPGKAL